MGRRRRKRVVPPRYCLRCKLERLPEETFPGGLCAACRHLNGKAHMEEAHRLAASPPDPCQRLGRLTRGQLAVQLRQARSQT